MSGGMYKGIAPACNIVMLKILDEYGSGTVKWTYDAINWLIRNKDIYNIRVINMSVGSSDRSVFSALSSAAEELWKKDMPREAEYYIEKTAPEFTRDSLKTAR